jgi:hypothetical protein
LPGRRQAAVQICVGNANEVIDAVGWIWGNRDPYSLLQRYR